MHSYRRRMALLLRVGEKRILRATVKAIGAAFNALNFAQPPSQVEDATPAPAPVPAPVPAPAVATAD
jgi:hypothetical protein